MKDEKFKLYDTTFKIGFGLTVLAFVILNILSYQNAVAEIKDWKSSGIDFGEMQPIWGFPFDMTNPFIFAVNTLIIVVCGFIVGLIFKLVWSKFQEKSLK